MKGKIRRLRFRLPRLNLTRETLKKSCGLPHRFCGTCSLREGSAVMITVIQVLTGLALAISLLLLKRFPQQIDDWWGKKLKSDFKPVFGKNFKDYARSFMHVWRSVAWALVSICSSYMFVGLGAIVGLLRKKGSLLWFCPWLIYTFLLLIASYVFVILEMAFLIIFTKQREVTITQEVMPIVLSMLFAVIWTYGFLIVVSHVKRRYAANKLALAKKQEMILKKRILREQVTLSGNKFG